MVLGQFDSAPVLCDMVSLTNNNHGVENGNNLNTDQETLRRILHQCGAVFCRWSCHQGITENLCTRLCQVLVSINQQRYSQGGKIMKQVTIKVEDREQVEVILGVLEDAEGNGTLDFSFSVQTGDEVQS